jgi:hypothetical protein
VSQLKLKLRQARDEAEKAAAEAAARQTQAEQDKTAAADEHAKVLPLASLLLCPVASVLQQLGHTWHRQHDSAAEKTVHVQRQCDLSARSACTHAHSSHVAASSADSITTAKNITIASEHSGAGVA